MQNHAKAVFQRHDRLRFEVCSLPTLSAPLLSKHISSIRPRKAVPQNSASAAAWKLCSDSASEHLAACCNDQARKAEHSSLDSAVILSAQLKDTDLCFIPKPNKPPTKPSNLRPLGIIRPDGKGLAGACRDLLAPYTSSYLRSVPQLAYQPQRGLSDALSRVSQHTREVRQMCAQSRLSRHSQHAGHRKPELAGGICFALDLSQAFDMVRRQDLMDTLQDAGVPSDIQGLVASLHSNSRYTVRSQQTSCSVESTTGIKQGCKLAPTLFSLLTGKLFRELAEVVGWDRVLHCLTGYADDLTVHHTVTSWRDLLQAHNMIADLLRIVRKYGFKVNADKCHIMVKLTGTASSRAHKLFSHISLDAQGAQHRRWRIGSTEAQESFPQSTSFKYLGVYVSYGNQEKATLDFRLQEGNAKLQQVRRYVHNRRLSGPKSRLKIWHTTVWATVSAGLVDIGLTTETAQQLRRWHARKIRAVLNKPVHLTGISTHHLYAAYGIKDPVQLLLERQSNRVRSLRTRQGAQTRPEALREASRDAQHPHGHQDAALLPNALQYAQEVLAEYETLLAATPEDEEPRHCCRHCSFQTTTEQGLHIHEAKMHKDKLDRYIPPDFLPEHSKDGLPTCAACHKNFTLWKGLKDHLLSGACREPAALRSIDAQRHAASAAAGQTDPVHPWSREHLTSTAGTHTVTQLARQPASKRLVDHCVLCGFWTPDHTKVKSHLHQEHRRIWDALQDRTTTQCQKLGTEILKVRPCPFCSKPVTDRRKHPVQCGVLFQILLGDSVLRINRTTAGPLQSFFRAAAPATPASSLFPPLSSPSSLGPSSPAALQPELQSDPSHAFCLSSSSSSLAALALKNTSNYCYVNATIQALLATTILDPSLRSLQALMSLISSSAQSRDATPLNLINSFPLRSLLPRWRFDGTQQDSAEFLQGFLTAASDLPLTRRWAAVDLTTGRLAVEGGPLVMLMQHSESKPLQFLIDEWASVPPNTTLLGQQKHAIFTVARFTGSGKNHLPITSYSQELRVPVLYEGSIRMERAYVQSCVFHIGSTPHSGHYRAIWRSTPTSEWRSTDDHRRSLKATDSDQRQVRHGSYIFFLTFPEASSDDAVIL